MWLGHAGFMVQLDGVTVLVDPNWAMWHGPVKRVRMPSLYAHDLPHVDLVLITHAHFDHLHLPSLRRIAMGQPIILPKGCGDLVSKLHFGQVIELETWQSIRFNELEITMTPARHWGARMIHDTYRQFGGYLISGTQRTVFHCGDSSMFDGFAEIGRKAKIDIALMPIGAYDAPSGRPVHMNPEEAVDAFCQLGAAHLVPMHYDTFPLGGEPLSEPADRLVRAAELLGIRDRVHVLREGNTLVR
jgi:L-ascorbate metabolism protein UlaG (beta-lactamase superfamily)